MVDPIRPLPAPPEPSESGSSDAAADQQPEPNHAPAPPPPPAPVATHTVPIGIIYPPQDIRVIIDKTAAFVAKNGPEFEKRILANSASNAKFSFLFPSDPYHDYYQHRITASDSKPSGPAPDAPGSNEAAADGANNAAPAEKDTASEKDDYSAPFRIVPEKKVLTPPKPEMFTVRLPEGITGEELDIVKLTAQFVARNGKNFLNKLGEREGNNMQFQFLRPTHSMFTFFTALTDAYSKVLMPDGGIDAVVKELTEGGKDHTTVLERCLNRLEWERSEEQARQKVEDEIERERLEMAMIDWHDFIVVETIEFAEDEGLELPAPLTIEEVIRRSKLPSGWPDVAMPDAVEPGKEVEMEMDEEEMQMVEEGMRAARIEENTVEARKDVTDVNEPPMRIVKNYKRPEERIASEKESGNKFVVSPITGELIPISEMEEHMRISLIDPKYKEQKERMLAKIKETTLAADDEISRNLMGLARTRPDIFGTTEEEVSNAVKAEIEKKDEGSRPVIWDGHSGSIGRTATQALSMGGEETNEGISNNLPGPAPAPRPAISLPRPPLPMPSLNLPRPPNASYTPMQSGVPVAPVQIPMVSPVRPPMPMHSVPMVPGQQPMMMVRGTMPQMPHMNTAMGPPPPPGSHFTPGVMPRPYMPMIPPPMSPMVPPPPQFTIPPPPPPEEAPPPLPDEPEPKRAKMDDSTLVPEDQFLKQHPGSARISVSVPNLDEGNLKGQVLEITVQSLSETVGNLKEKIAGELQLPANKQKLSGRAGFLKDNLTLAYYNVVSGEMLSLALRERGGRRK